MATNKEINVLILYLFLTTGGARFGMNSALYYLYLYLGIDMLKSLTKSLFLLYFS